VDHSASSENVWIPHSSFCRSSGRISDYSGPLEWRCTARTRCWRILRRTGKIAEAFGPVYSHTCAHVHLREDSPSGGSCHRASDDAPLFEIFSRWRLLSAQAGKPDLEVAESLIRGSTLRSWQHCVGSVRLRIPSKDSCCSTVFFGSTFVRLSTHSFVMRSRYWYVCAK